MKQVLILLILLLSFEGIAQLNNPKLHLSNNSLFSEIQIKNNGYTYALILVNDTLKESTLTDRGIFINSKINQIWSIQVPVSKMLDLSQIPGILYVEKATYANASRIKNDIERQSSSVDKVHTGLLNSLPLNYTGKGVIVGIVDIGFQNNNPTFFSQDGKKTRISRYWHQGIQGNPPEGFSYGKEFKDSQEIILANDMDGTHGTHVAGIAAGSGLSTPNFQYKGMAPDAELVFVTIKYSNDTLAGSALGDYVVANPCIIDAYRYIFDYANSVGKPAVINLSWGMHTGPHDGTSLFDLACDMLVGRGKVLVGANGNDGDNPMHWFHAFNNDTVATMMMENNRQWRTKESVYCDFWGSKSSSFAIQVQVIDTSLNVVYQTPFISSLSDSLSVFNITADSAFFKIELKAMASYINNQKPNIIVMIEQPNQAKYALIARIYSDSSNVHAWNSGAVRSWSSGAFRNKWGKWDYENSMIAGNTQYTLGENGGTSKSVISVGATAARSSYTNVNGQFINDSGYVWPGQLAKFSSRGPSVDGRIKPNVVAPGYDVPSAVNNQQFAAWMLEKTLLKSVFRGDTQYWTAFNGTSMAAPHVAGIVALVMQANPNLTAEQVKLIIETTAISDSQTGTTPNNDYGYGKINAYAAVLKALQIAGINAYHSPVNFLIYPNPSSDFISIQSAYAIQPHQVSVVNALGQIQTPIIKYHSSINLLEMDIRLLSDGIYTLLIKHEGETFIYKILKF
ncbi:MAG: S8 family peptidase [Bacteroidota bacterium]|nr:S8 family peptidase [Bacteroidota bacterium]